MWTGKGCALLFTRSAGLPLIAVMTLGPCRTNTRTRAGITVMELTIVVAILLLLAAISLPAVFQNQHKREAAECARNLEAIRTACHQYASEVGGFPAALSDLVPDYLPDVPVCPAGGTYTLGTPEGAPPTCSVPGHRLEPARLP